MGKPKCVAIESRSPWLGLSILVFLLELVSVGLYYAFKDQALLGTGIIWDFAFKGEPMIFIIINAALLNTSARGWRNKFRVLSFVALLFGLLGDYVIINSSQSFLYFYLGMAAFLIGHIFYLAGFWVRPFVDDDRPPWQLWALLGVSLVCIPVFAGLLYLMATNGSSIVLIVAVVIYGLIEILVLWRSAARLKYYASVMAEHLTFQIVTFVGAVLFVASDAVLAYDAFYYAPLNGGQSIFLRGVWVLGLYWSGQTLLMFGIFIRPKAVVNKDLEMARMDAMKYIEKTAESKEKSREDSVEPPTTIDGPKMISKSNYSPITPITMTDKMSAEASKSSSKQSNPNDASQQDASVSTSKSNSKSPSSTSDSSSISDGEKNSGSSSSEDSEGSASENSSSTFEKPDA